MCQWLHDGMTEKKERKKKLESPTFRYESNTSHQIVPKRQTGSQPWITAVKAMAFNTRLLKQTWKLDIYGIHKLACSGLAIALGFKDRLVLLVPVQFPVAYMHILVIGNGHKILYFDTKSS